MRLILDHSIVGQSELTNFAFDKTKPYAGCRICGAVFQSSLLHNPDLPPQVKARAEAETLEWRQRHCRTHTLREREQFVRTGRTLTPQAAHQLAPLGLAPLSDAVLHDDGGEYRHAMGTAPRAPLDDVEGSLRNYVAPGLLRRPSVRF
jgi:hypothetical protein